MRPARAPVPQPSVPEHRHDVRPGEAGDIPNCFAESGTRSFGQEMIEQRNCAANTTKYSVAAVAGKMRIDRHLRLQSPMDGADRLFEYRSEEHTSELQSLMSISYAVVGVKKNTVAKKRP